MLPLFMIAMSAPASARIASAIRSPRFVSLAQPAARRVERHARRADHCLELGAEPALVCGDDGGGSRIVGYCAGDRDELVEALEHTVASAVDVYSRDPACIGARLAEKRAVLSARDPVVLVSADDQIDVGKPIDQLDVVGKRQVRDGDDDGRAFALHGNWYGGVNVVDLQDRERRPRSRRTELFLLRVDDAVVGADRGRPDTDRGRPNSCTDDKREAKRALHLMASHPPTCVTSTLPPLRMTPTRLP
jgi:hypothetical protein